MILEIWLWCTTISLGLLIGGLTYDKNLLTRLVLLCFSVPFLILSTFYSFEVDKVCCGSTAVLSQTFNYTGIALLFSVLFVITTILILEQVFRGVYDTVKEAKA